MRNRIDYTTNCRLQASKRRRALFLAYAREWMLYLAAPLGAVTGVLWFGWPF